MKKRQSAGGRYIQTNILLPPEIHHRLHQAALDEGKSASLMVSEMLDKHLN